MNLKLYQHIRKSYYKKLGNNSPQNYATYGSLHWVVNNHLKIYLALQVLVNALKPLIYITLYSTLTVKLYTRLQNLQTLAHFLTSI